MARPRFHALVTAALAHKVARDWGLAGVAGTVAGGLLIDADHLVDYGWTRLSGRRTHFLAPLHGWEISLLLALAAWWAQREAERADVLPDVWSPRLSHLGERLGARRLELLAAFLVGLSAGSGAHLAHDVVSNRPEHLATYSLLFRAWHKFDRGAVGWAEHPDFHGWSGKPWYHWF